MSSQEPAATRIDIPFPTADERHLRIRVGACRLKISPGAGATWVTGSYEDPTGLLPLRVTQEGGTARIIQEPELASFPSRFGGAARLELALGDAQPYLLTLEGGASDNTLDLGGLPITRLVARQGAGRYQIDFSAPNPTEMSLLDIESGAVSMEIRNLANAGFTEMSVDGGAASYKFDFGGSLRRAAHVRIQTGVSSVEISVPGSTAASITTETVLGHLDVGDGFTKRESAFWTESAVAGGKPVMTLHVSVALGALRLRTLPTNRLGGQPERLPG